MRSLVSTVFLLALAAVTSAGDRAPGRASSPASIAEPHPGIATLPRFVLYGWVAPPADSTTPENYAELAAAGFNATVLAWQDPGTVPANLARLECSQPVGVKNLLLDNRLDHVREDLPATYPLLDAITSDYRDHPAFLGYYLGDEPEEDRFPRIAEWFRLLRSRDPLHPGWNNLFGRGSFPSRDAFLAYLRSYVNQVQPAVLSTDHYDHLETGDRGLFIDNVSATAQVAREGGVPFWGVVLLIQHGGTREVDDGLLSWQVAQWLAYGARGICYFTYWTPAPDPQWNWTYGMIHWGTGARSPHYDRVRTLNQLVRPVGEALADLTWLSTEHVGGVPAGGTAWSPDGLVVGVEGRATLGTFVSPAGQPHLFVANRDSSAWQEIVLELAGERTIERLTSSGQWMPFGSQPSPAGRRVALGLSPGAFVLLRTSGTLGVLESGGSRATLAAWPEPARGTVRFTAQGVEGAATLTVVDAGGRRVWSSIVERGAPVVSWNGIGERGGPAQPGIYWARLEDARGAVVRRFTWLGRS